MRNPITREDVLASRVIADPLHLLDCCIISDGGGAVIVTSLERAKDLKQKPIIVRGTGESVAHREIGAPDLTTIAAKQSGEHAFAMAGLTPSDIDFCTLYDSFTITVLCTLENLGFCKMGEGGGFVENDGIFLVIEAVRQLRGGLGDRQVEGAEVALAHGTGGYLGLMHSGATLILSSS